MFALYVCQMCCKLEVKTFNNHKTTASLQNHWKCCMCSNPCICTTQQYSFCFSKVLHENCRIFPWSFDIVVTSDIPTRYLIFFTNFLLTTFSMSCDFSWMPSFSQLHGVSLFGNIKMCCSLLQWSDVHTWILCRTCTVRFFWSLLRIFSSFPLFWVCEMKILLKVASSCAEDLKPVFYT